MGSCRHRHLLSFALSSLARRPARALVVLCAYGALVFMLTALLVVTGSLRREVADQLRGAPALVVQRLAGGRHAPIPIAHARILQGIRGVDEAVPRLWGYVYDPAPDVTYTIIGSSSLPPEAGKLLEGDFRPDVPGACVVGAGVADARDLETGDLLPLRRPGGGVLALRVTGVFRSESALLTSDLLVTGAEDARTLLALPPDAATDIALRVPNPREADTVARKVQELMPDCRPVTRDQLARTYDASFGWRSGVWGAVLAGVLLSFLMLAWDKASGLSADERREIGILRASGWTVEDVLTLKFWEALALSSAAAMGGMIAGYLHALLSGPGIFRPVLMGWSTRFPDFPLAPVLDPLQALAVLLAVVAPYLAVVLVPAWRAAVTDPDQAIRG